LGGDWAGYFQFTDRRDEVPRKAADEIQDSARVEGKLDIDYRLRLSGKLTGSSAGTLERAIRAALQGSPHEIVVDLTDVDSIDQTGMTALLKAHLRSRQRGLPIKFVPADHEAVKQVAAFTGADELPD
jgi:anti-anti-sigma factor